MASIRASTKRKAPTKDHEPEEELLNGTLDGAFSQSGDDDNGDDDDDSDIVSIEGASFDFDDEDEEDGFPNEEDDQDLHSDDIPSDDEGKGPANGDVGKELNGDDAPNFRVEKDANGQTRYIYDEVVPDYDSDDSDAQGPDNRIGDIPLSFYDAYPHIGYDINGKKVMRPATGDALDALLETIEIPKGWTGLTDPSTGKPLHLSQDELELLRRVQMNEIPADGHDPYPETVEYFTGIEEKMPLSAAPEPKRRFVPSQHEAKRIQKLVRAIREGRILPYKPPEERDAEKEEEDEPLFDLWHNEQPRDPHVMNIPAPKLPPPGYDLSYNPPPEYLPTQDEKQAWDNTDPEERDKEYLPNKYDSLRKVPGYDMFVKERFERCLDLYLAPRIRKNRLNIDPNSLLPKLPRPEDLRPWPSCCQTTFEGHQGRVRSVAVDPTGNWLASGGDDGTVRVWAILTGRQVWSVNLDDESGVDSVRWRPTRDSFIVAAACAEDVYLIIPRVIDPGYSIPPEIGSASEDVLDAGFGFAANANAKQTTTDSGSKAAQWTRPSSRLMEDGVKVKVTVRAPVKTISWHRRGDHFCTVSPSGQRSSVAIHTLSKHLTQIPFRKFAGLVQTAHFHPSRPLFFVATQRTIRCYDLQKLELVKSVQPGAKWISSFDVHPGGGNLIVGSYDRRLLWHDLEMSNLPYKTMRFNAKAVRAVQFHRGEYPLFATASDDGTLQILHGKVYNDSMENATIVPLKILRGHKVVQSLGVMDVDWHPKQPWVVSAGADGTCKLWM